MIDERQNMKIKKAVKIVLIVLGAIFLIIGVPIIINECYKANSGYTTVWMEQMRLDTMVLFGDLLLL